NSLRISTVFLASFASWAARNTCISGGLRRVLLFMPAIASSLPPVAAADRCYLETDRRTVPRLSPFRHTEKPRRLHHTAFALQKSALGDNGAAGPAPTIRQAASAFFATFQPP